MWSCWRGVGDCDGENRSKGHASEKVAVVRPAAPLPITEMPVPYDPVFLDPPELLEFLNTEPLLDFVYVALRGV